MRYYIRFFVLSIVVVTALATYVKADSFEDTNLFEVGLFEERQTNFDELFFSDRPYFSVEIDTFDTYLGQRRRRRGDGGRVWTNLYYGMTKLEPKDARYDIKPDIYGVQLGFDIVQEHGVYSSFFGNFNQSDIDFGKFAKAKNRNYLFGYGKYVYLAGCHFGFTASLGYDEYKVRDRTTGIQGTGDGMQTNIFGEFGIDLIFGQWAIKPFYALQYDFLYHGRIGEKGKAFKGDWNGHGFNQLFGLRVNWKPADIIEFQLRTTWVHEFLDPPPFYHARFSAIQGTSTPAVYFYKGNTGRDWAWVGLGLKIEAVYNVLMYLDYDCTVNGRHITHFGNLGLCFGW